MHITMSSLLGIVFLVLSLAATFSMFHFWGYEYDEVNKKSTCPQWKMNIHRVLGVAYIVVYVLMMVEMVPRLWEYQVDFSARTVVHILLGSFIGIILVLKVSIIRFFRHFEEWMPALGTSLMIASVLLAVMSLPAYYHERTLAEGAVGGGVFSEANRARVARLLVDAGFPKDVPLGELTTEAGLESGRRVLLDKCISCHDLKTVIAKPRTPQDWVRTCDRMVAKPSLAGVITDEEGHRAAAYLIAITPDLQRSAKSKRADQIDRVQTQQAAEDVLVVDPDLADAGVPEPGDAGTEVESAEPVVAPGATVVAPKAGSTTAAKPRYDFKKAKALYEEECSLCHETSDTDKAPPSSRKEVNQLLQRMVDNGLELDREDLALIRYYLVRTYVNK